MRMNLRRGMVTLLATLSVGAQASAMAMADPEPAPAADDPLTSHMRPRWFDDAKLGFFVHWGAYSVPAYAPKEGGRKYAEWYWLEMQSAAKPTHAYHRDTHGAASPTYDQFIEQWKPNRFDPHEWLSLFERGGGKYFVVTAKHHDGLALFRTATTGRNTVDLGPRRDLVGELFSAADSGAYGLKRGVYYSMPEWFHPNYPAYGPFGAGAPRNPYTGQPETYTGYRPIENYVRDHQAPQMRELIDQYRPDILWCDINGVNDSDNVMRHYFTQAAAWGREVTVNNRCGNGRYDFTTPEYAVEPTINPSKWESTRGIGDSFGFNQYEDVSDYASTDELVDMLVDVVAKNGNLLLNIGPRADGSIPEIQRERVEQLGDWLAVNGEAIYGTTYWNRADDLASEAPMRYTVKDGALYATALRWPGEKLTLSGDLPLGAAGKVTLLGSDGQSLPWRRDGDRITVDLPTEPAASPAYVFKVETPGVHSLPRVEKVKLPRLTEPGKPFQVEVPVTNTGATTAPDTQMQLSLPAGWSAEPDKQVVIAPAARSTSTVRFTVMPVADGPPGQRAIGVRVRSGAAHYTAPVGEVRHGFRNVALGAAATQKSVGFGGVPERAVDGRTDGAFSSRSVTHTAQPETQAWWQVDLGSSMPINSVELWNRTDCCSTRLQNYYLLVSDVPFGGTTLADALATPGVRAIRQTAVAGRPTAIPLNGTGRYVRIQLASGTDPLSLAEVDVLSPVGAGPG